MTLTVVTEKAVGLTLAIGGNLLISISLNLQKHVHRQYGDRHYTEVRMTRSRTSRFSV